MKSTYRQKLPLPSIEEVARVKAKAFGREIFIHGATAAKRCGFNLKPRPFVAFSVTPKDEEYKAAERERHRLGLIYLGWFKPDEDYLVASISKSGSSSHAAKQIVQRVFAVVGRTTSFMYGKVRIVLQGTAQRYLKLGDSIPGLFLRGLLYAVRHKDIRDHLNSSPILLRREHKQLLRDSRWQMPSWLSDQFFINQWQPQALTNNCLMEEVSPANARH
jgi:hypothetical protein